MIERDYLIIGSRYRRLSAACEGIRQHDKKGVHHDGGQ